MTGRGPLATLVAAALAVGLAPLARPDAAGPRARALAAAQARVGQRYQADCSGFVIAIWRTAGISLRLHPARSRSESLQVASRKVARPRPGDLAFFDHTYDRNRDGRANDPFTHVALVEAVEGKRVTMLHRGSKGVERIRMDLARPSDAGTNDPVRRLRRGEDPTLRVLAGELFAGFGAVPGAD